MRLSAILVASFTNCIPLLLKVLFGFRNKNNATTMSIRRYEKLMS